jgi:Ser/Thr protein kinase RdoA (MazF antagonist)
MQWLGERFRIEGELLGVCTHGSGHIHDTFVAEYASGGAPRRYLLQRLNTRIFRDPVAVCENVVRISDHLNRKLAERGVSDRGRRCLAVIPGRDGRPFCIDDEGSYWRAFHFIEGTRTCDTVEEPAQAYQAARSFGEFAADLVDLSGPPPAVTIPDFHDLAKRFGQLQEALHSDDCGRAAAVGSEIESASGWYERLERALAEAGFSALPRRVVHNDCKLNNVLLDADTGEGLCVIDLDTVMEGSILSDFGELVRSGTCRSPEDERNLASMAFDLELFAALTAGYLAGTADFLTAPERRILPLAGPNLTLENALRFLADYLSGDVYFRIHREGHNLERARAQLRLLELMMESLEDARRAVAQSPGAGWVRLHSSRSLPASAR